jgi:hypothetical protein
MIRTLRRGLMAAALLMAIPAAMAAGMAAAPAPAGAAPRFITGGVSEEEREAILHDAASYNLWLVLAEQGTGYYLADVRVTVSDAGGRTVVDTLTDGPWLFAQLPPGHYTVRLGNGDVRHVTIGAGRTMAVVRLAGVP